MAPVPEAAKPWAQSRPVCSVFLLIAVLAAAIADRVPTVIERGRLRAGAIALAGFMAVAYSGVIVNALVTRSADAPAEVAELKQHLPAGMRLVSLNSVRHLFAYLYGEPIELHPWPTCDDSNLTWFCFSSVGDYRAPLPFAWEEVAVISVDRNRHAKPENVVVVGRRTASVLRASR